MARFSQVFNRKYTKDPHMLGISWIPAGNLTIKLAVNTVEDSNASAFNAPFDEIGAYASVATDTVWATIVDITGGGHMGCILGVVSGIGDSSELRITVDGVVSEILLTQQTPARLCLGAVNYQYNTTSSTGGSQSMYDYSFRGHTTGTYQASAEGIIGSQLGSVAKTSDMIADGRPVLRFDSSLKVEARTDDVTTGQSAICFVAYELDARYV